MGSRKEEEGKGMMKRGGRRSGKEGKEKEKREKGVNEGRKRQRRRMHSDAERK